MSESNRFGKIVSPWTIERAMASTIALWIRDYLEEVGRDHGYEPNQIQAPQAIVTRTEFEKWAEEPTNCVLVMCSDMAGKPERRAQGAYDASWLVSATAVVSDQDQEATHKLKLVYVTALRLLIAQHKMLKSPLYPAGVANFSEWQSENYDQIPALAERSLGSASVIFSVGVENVMTEQAGPRTPSATPWIDPGQWPLISDVEVDVQPVALEESVA